MRIALVAVLGFGILALILAARSSEEPPVTAVTALSELAGRSSV